MGSLSSMTIWIVLSTIVPGLISIACVSVIIYFIFPDYAVNISNLNEWIMLSLCVFIMILNQFLGILLEKTLIYLKMMPSRIDYDSTIELFKKNGNKSKNELLSLNNIKWEIDTNQIYSNIYFIISQMKPDDDAYGHVQRIISQYFLTNNTIVPFLGSSVFILIHLYLCGYYQISTTKTIEIILLFIMVLLSLISYFTARIRFCSMIKCLYSLHLKHIN